MVTSIPIDAITDLTIRQLELFFPISIEDRDLIHKIIGRVFQRLEKNFSHNHNKYYSLDGEVYFNPFHSGQYCVYLYYLSNEVWRAQNSLLADKVYYLNKIMNGLDLFYQVKLPDFFMLDHPVGSVIGRGNYSNGFSFGQNCTVGNNNGIYPTIGNNFRMCANSAILGNCHVGNNVTLGAGAIVKDQDIPSNSLVFGQSPNLVIKHKK